MMYLNYHKRNSVNNAEVTMRRGDKYFKMQSHENESIDLQQAKAETAFWWHTHSKKMLLLAANFH